MAEPTGKRLGRGRALASLIAAAFTLRIRRFEIADRSMEPTLGDGDWVLGAVRPGTVRPGDIVVLEMPGRPGFEIVKRVAAIGDGSLLLEGDNPAAGSVDSETFGPVPAAAVSARLVLRYRPLPPHLLR